MDDGLAYPKNGCSSFELDKNTLTKEQLDMLAPFGNLHPAEIPTEIHRYKYKK